MDFVWIGFFSLHLLLQTRCGLAFPKQQEKQSLINNQEINIEQLQSELIGPQEMEPDIHLSKDFKDADFAADSGEYLPELLLDTRSKISKRRPETSLEQVVRRVIKRSNIHDNISDNPTVINRPFDILVNQKANRVKRGEDKNSLSDMSDLVNEICLTEECLEVLRQYIEWRKQNGYPARTGVTSIG